MALRKRTLKLSPGDNYRTVADLFGVAGISVGAKLVEGFIQALTNGATLYVASDTTDVPGPTDPGFSLAVGAGQGWGPAYRSDAALDLANVWVRNTTAGSNATVIVQGIFDVG